ncbi:MAG: peptidoglycan DD-metalloendopeptidase family protein [Anaerolineaceae bacterium]|nr:peptidoglycan DD-metalloendopeptidase family protein [Anaerolineaceae bacterium]
MRVWRLAALIGQHVSRLLVPIMAWLLLAAPITTQAQSGTCGVVDAIDYPVPTENLVRGYDDFGLFRKSFGGNHTGVDLDFDHWGDPVKAAARGLVTYSDALGWDTEKGVVILSHDFPDGSRSYSLYGHVEETDTIKLPPVGTCVERGQIIAAVGWPSRGRPHLHFEFRSILPREGGPGYVSNNPLDDGWFNPLDFIATWRAKLNPAFLKAISFDNVASLPPTQMDNGAYLTASGSLISAVMPPDQPLWQIQTDSPIDGLTALSGDRVVAHSSSGQTVTLNGGRFGAVWNIASVNTPFVTLGERLIFLMQDESVNAYDAAGTLIWTLPNRGQVVYFGGNDSEMAIATRGNDGIVWQTLNAEGQGPSAVSLKNNPLVSVEADGKWLVLDGQTLLRINAGQSETIGTVSQSAGDKAQIASDVIGNVYLYSGGSEQMLTAIGKDGSQRWSIPYPHDVRSDPPLLASGNGCLLYTLDADGMLNVFSAADGQLVNQIGLYAGGRRTTNPRGRLLKVDAAEQVYVGSGFLSLMVFDGTKLGGDTKNCLAG